ncbi:FimB/Mfa2 family fimbrial subunit [Chitinophaga filiformis]|uniref:FimB/Mfa2 family fimbrial subunit n=1 Tax=Chitinophaga filiformis TaxID=104663 RepID=UPI001F2CBAEF|nr:FimB/Mfa2 family fimbrial subunit [Chitinophaga filiformis]MCF6407188.1 FimB/Mfa2 family fimbrial subunit [Chitinophaga filiformis]
MRKLFLAVCALSLSLIACKKDTAPVKPVTTDNEKRVALNIRANDFLQQVEPLPGSRTVGIAGALRDSVLAAKVQHLYYILYDDAGNRLKFLHQDANVTENFGSFYDTAAPGYYKMVLLASQSPLDVNADSQLSASSFALPVTGSGEIENMPDIFYSKNNVWVPDDYGNDAMILNMTLDRIVGNLQVNILDMPQPGSGDTSVAIKITPEAFTFFLDPGTTYVGAADIFNAKLNRVNLNVFSAYVLNTVTPFTVTINYVDPTTGQPQTKVIHNVSCYKNRRTILSGYLYGGSAPENPGIKLFLLDAWDNNENKVEF